MVNIRSGVGIGGGNIRMAGNLSNPSKMPSGAYYGGESQKRKDFLKKEMDRFDNFLKGPGGTFKVEADRQDNTFGKEIGKFASSDLSGISVGDVKLAGYTPQQPSYTDTDDAYQKIKETFEKTKPKPKDDYKTEAYRFFTRKKEGSEKQNIDEFKRKSITYGTDADGTPTATDFFGDKINYSPETIKRYIATDAKEEYDRKQAIKREKQDQAITNALAATRKKIDDTAYKRAYERYEKPSITQRVSNFVFGTDLKGKPDPRNVNILSKDERIDTLRGVQRSYDEPGISVDPYGVMTRRSLGEQVPTSDLSVQDIKARQDAERTKIMREAAGKTPNPNLMERTQNFLSGVADNVSKIFTPKVEAGTLEGKPTRFTMGESNVASMSTPSVGDMVSNIGAAVESGGRGGLGRPTSTVRTLGKPQPRVKSPMESGMGPGAAKARAMAKARNAAKDSGTAAPSMSGADRAKALAKARIAKKKKSTSSGTGFGRSTSSSRRSTSSRRGSTGRAGRRGGSAGSAGSRSRGGTSRGSSRSGTRSSSSRGQGSRSRSTSRSRGGVSRGSRRRGGRRGRRGGRRCDIRLKYDINILSNYNLYKDDLAQVAYFVMSIKN